MVNSASSQDPCNQIHCATCSFRSKSDWWVLNDDETSLLDRAKQVKYASKRDMIYTQGEPCHSVFCVVSGIVALRKSDSDGNSILVRLVHAGQTLGYRDLFLDKVYTNTAEVLRPSIICRIPECAVRELMDHNPKLGRQFLIHSAADQESTEESLLQQITLPVRSRLIHLLLELKDRYGHQLVDGSIELSLPLTRQDIAALLGTRPETIARTIGNLNNDQVMNFNGRTVKIPNLQTLLDEIEMPGM